MIVTKYEAETGHRRTICKPACNGCHLCDGGLFLCKVCGEAEAVLKDHCPGPEFKHGDCSACHDAEVLLCLSEQEDEPLHYVCKECFLRGY